MNLPQEHSSPWTLLITGHLLGNTPYGLQQLQALQLWTNDLDPKTLSNAIERVYTAFFYSDSSQHLQYVEEEVLFSHFVTTLNDAFKWQLALEDVGYESGSESFSVPTPLHREP